MKVFQNKFFLVCLCVALVICTVSTTFSLMGFREPVREVIGVVTTPLRWVASVVTDGVGGFFEHFKLQSALIDRNEALEKENQSLRDQSLRADLLEEESARLRNYLDMKDKYPTFLLEEGMVIGSESSGYMTVFTLNRGTAHGIAINMPVIVKEGVVGYVTEVGLTWCKVSTILEKGANSKGIGAYVADKGTMGVVQGDYTLEQKGLCKMSYIEEGADIAVGDVIVSSGVGSVYPNDLIIGTVIEVGVDEYTRTIVATVRPAVDFSSLKYMLIVTGYEQSGDGYQKPSGLPETEDEEDQYVPPGIGNGGYG